MGNKIRPDASVVEMPKRQPAPTKESERKWGVEVMARGQCILPSLIFKAQRRLGLSATQLVVLLHIADFWWKAGDLPWPKKLTVAERLNVTEKQVQRVIRELEKGGYVRRIPRMTSHGQTSNGYDLSGLVAKLKELAPEFKAAADAKRKVERRGGLKVTSA